MRTPAAAAMPSRAPGLTLGARCAERVSAASPRASAAPRGFSSTAPREAPASLFLSRLYGRSSRLRASSGVISPDSPSGTLAFGVHARRDVFLGRAVATFAPHLFRSLRDLSSPRVRLPASKTPELVPLCFGH